MANPMIAIRETEDAQNTVANLKLYLSLNVDNPSAKIKSHFAKVQVLITKLHLELDLLNDLKEDARLGCKRVREK